MTSKYQCFKLKDLIRLKAGQRSFYTDDGEYPVFGAGEKSTGFCDKWNNDGQITIARKGTVGRVYKRNFKHYVAEASYLVEITSDVILEDYLYQWLLSKEHLLIQLKTPALIPELDVKAFMDLEIKVPPIEVQKKIISLLKQYKWLLDMRSKEELKLIEIVKSYKEIVSKAFEDVLAEKKEEDI